MVLIVEVYGLLTVAVAAATKRVAPTVVAMLLLATGQAEVLLMNLYVIEMCIRDRRHTCSSSPIPTWDRCIWKRPSRR